ncbi:hypothetical protein EYB26_004969 [Talaromyces marneffei]|uniref:uncharacterized protein n=1 Tax=Talaromyces marneffei TaxID=37727 RepID=UPI0012A80890|nr:uncharacterized protein EYB26_004969 [Talaromyces marneffei]QGA17298.1 hypothetical protein EYB26_004969 [Talaromyces marneffei]
MVNFKTIISALLALAAAAPFPSNTNFSIQQVAVRVPPVHPAAIYARDYIRYGVKVPDHVALAARSGWIDSVVTTPFQHDVVYLTPIQVGGSSLQVYFDTASANLWVYTPQTPAVGSHATYNTQSGRLIPNYYWNSVNVEGVISRGRVFVDKVRVGNHLMYPLQAVQVVDDIEPVSAMYEPLRAYDGIFGLAFSKGNTVLPIKQKTFFDNIKEWLNEPLFAVYVKHGAPGGYDFGWTDPRKYKGDIVWEPVYADEGLWKISVNGYSIGDQSFSSTPFFAIIDTGTTLLLLQEDLVAEYYQKIPGSYNCEEAGGYIFPCSSIIPEFKLKIGQHIAVVPGEFMIYTATNSTHCFGGIQTSPQTGRNYLGNVFLKSQYVIFYDHPQRRPWIGIAAQA